MSLFIRRVDKRPLRRWSEAKDRRTPSTSFLHQVEVRPARFRLVPGMNTRPWDDEAVLAAIEGAAMRRAFYVGRVVDLSEGGNVILVNLWEYPSAREMTVSLPVDDKISGSRPAPGDQLNLWTWIELPGGGEVSHRYHGRILRRELSLDELAELRGLAATLSHGEDEG